MSSLILRLAKGSPLTNAEVDGNFSALNADKIEADDTRTLTNKVIDSITNTVGADHIHFKVKATEAIAKGQVVRAVGFNAGENAFEVALVTSAAHVAIGVSHDTLLAGSFGAVINTGLLENFDTSAFAEGAILYPNTSGGFTATQPSSGTYQALAFVVRSHANHGAVLIEASEPAAVRTSSNVGNTVVLRDASGNFSAGTITAALSGNALTATSAGKWTTARTLSFTGDVTGSGSVDGSTNVATSLALANSGVTSGTYTKVTVDAKGRVTTGASLSSGDVTTALGFTPYNATNPSGYTSNTGTVTSVGGTGGYGGLTLSGTVTTSGNLTLGGTPTGTWPISISGSAASVPITTTFNGTYPVVVNVSGALYSNTGITYTGSTGTLAATTFSGALTGNATTATTLQTTRTINGTGFNGSANITITANTASTLTRGSYLTGSNFNGSAPTTWAVDATSANTASKVVARDASGNFSAGTITASLSGIATSAGSATNAANVYLATAASSAAYKVPFGNTTISTSGNYGLLQDSTATFTYNPGTNTLVVGTVSGALSGNATSATSVYLTTSTTAAAFKVPFGNTTASTSGNYGLLQDSTATFTYNPSTNTLAVGTVSGALSGNATTATTLATARTINGTSFNGSASITTANWGTARTLSLSGDATGSVSINGSANVTLSVAVVDDSHTHDGRYYTESESDGRFYRYLGEMGSAVSLDGLQTTGRWHQDSNAEANGTGYPTARAGLLHVYGDGYKYQQYQTYDGADLYFRTYYQSWSSWKTVLHSSNYNSYSPTLTGGGASGTWGISISGAAASAVTLTSNATISGLNFGGVLALTASGASTGNSTGARLSESYGPVWNLSNSATWHYQILNGSLLAGLSANGGNYGGGNIYATGNITAYYSDERLKTSLGRIENALKKVRQLEGFRYVNNDLAKGFGFTKEEPQLGLSAQAAQRVAPETVSLAPFDMTSDPESGGRIYSKSGENYLTVQYDRLVPLLVEAIKEQDDQVVEMAKDNLELRARIERLEALVEKLIGD